MLCPRCFSNLKEEIVNTSPVLDRCAKCRGVWLDSEKLSHFITDKGFLDLFLKEGLQNKNDTLDKCPRCEVVCLKSGFCPGFRFEVDECPRCKGLWLDGHEYDKLSQSKTLEPEAIQRQIELQLGGGLPAPSGARNFILKLSVISLFFWPTLFLTKKIFFPSVPLRAKYANKEIPLKKDITGFLVEGFFTKMDKCSREQTDQRACLVLVPIMTLGKFVLIIVGVFMISLVGLSYLVYLYYRSRH